LSADEIESGLEQGRLHLGISFASSTLLDWRLSCCLRRIGPDCPCNSSGQSRVHFCELDKEPLILLHSGFCTAGLDKGLQAAGVCANLLIEMNTIQGVLATVRRQESYGAPSLALRLQEGENLCAVKLTAPTLRRSIGLFDATAIDVLLLVPLSNCRQYYWK